MSTASDILTAAAQAAQHAPSALNTQPWTWYHSGDALELYADRDRQLSVADPAGRLLLLSCGTALHHAATSITAAGYTPLIERSATTFTDNRLARITLGPPRTPTDTDTALAAAIEHRHTDRRPYTDRPVNQPTLDTLTTAATTHHTRLHIVRAGHMPMLAIATAQAGATQMSDPDYRNELLRWTNRPTWAGDGIPPGATVTRVPRRVPVRELALEPHTPTPIEPGGDHGAAYLIVYGPTDTAPAWLTAGEASSAILLTATTAGLATAPISDVIEVPHPRDLITGLLPPDHYPYLVIRCGYAPTTPAPTHTPRRSTTETIIDGGQ